MVEFPNKKYHIIYADPPWKFSSKHYIDGKFVDLNYVTQKKNWIKNLPIDKISQEDCALFLWSTDAHLKEAIEVMESWGFKYVTVAFIWEKITSTGKTCTSIGTWTLKSYEMCLFGTKGKMLKYKKTNNVHQKILAFRKAHSEKPNEARKRIVALFGDLPRIELFARQKTNGWDVWGNEIDKFSQETQMELFDAK